VTRHLEDDGSRYFGPYTDVGAMRRALNVVKRIFTVRSCNFDMPRQMPERPCLDYYIKRCKAPCILAQTQGEYRAMIDEVLIFLEGRTGEVARRVRQRMELAVESLDFERAASCATRSPSRADVRADRHSLDRRRRPRRDRLRARRRRRGGRAHAHSRRQAAGSRAPVPRERRDETDAAVLEAYLAGSYLPLEDRAAELLVPFDPRSGISSSRRSSGARSTRRSAARARARRLATQKCSPPPRGAPSHRREAEERAGDPIYELQRRLGLQKVPRALVCFDISHAQGTDTVASCVWFQNGRPYRAEYRKFKIKTVEGIDDFASMHEIVTRYFTRRTEEGKSLPDLVVIDGGKGQLNAAHAALSAIGLAAMPMISLAKREEEIFMIGRSEPLRLSRRSPALRVIQQARDEAHRFAITFQRKRRAMRTVTSELMKVPGIGDAKRRVLLEAFGSLQGVRDASVEAIAALPGFGQKRRTASSPPCASRRHSRRPRPTLSLILPKSRTINQPQFPKSPPPTHREHLASRVFGLRHQRIW
jgi:excinuclease ABC subunit C